MLVSSINPEYRCVSILREVFILPKALQPWRSSLTFSESSRFAREFITPASFVRLSWDLHQSSTRRTHNYLLTTTWLQRSREYHTMSKHYSGSWTGSWLLCVATPQEKFLGACLNVHALIVWKQPWRQKNTAFNGSWTEATALTCTPGHVAAQFNRHGNCATATVDTVVLRKFQAACVSKITVELTISCLAVLWAKRSISESVADVLRPVTSNAAALCAPCHHCLGYIIMT